MWMYIKWNGLKACNNGAASSFNIEYKTGNAAPLSFSLLSRLHWENSYEIQTVGNVQLTKNHPECLFLKAKFQTNWNKHQTCHAKNGKTVFVFFIWKLKTSEMVFLSENLVHFFTGASTAYFILLSVKLRASPDMRNYKQKPLDLRILKATSGFKHPRKHSNLHSNLCRWQIFCFFKMTFL